MSDRSDVAGGSNLVIRVAARAPSGDVVVQGRCRRYRQIRRHRSEEARKCSMSVGASKAKSQG